MTSNEPLWLAEAAQSMPAWPAARGDLKCEVLVIGGGIAGASAALALQARDVDVLLVERAGPGRGASGRNGGFVLLTHVFELPKMARELGARGRDVIGMLLSLARENRELLRARFGAQAQLRPSGSTMLSVKGQDDEAAMLEEAASILNEAGFPASLGRADFQGLRGFDVALDIDEDASIHPGALMAEMTRGVRRAVIADVETLAPREARYAGGTITFDKALVATNAHASRLVPALEGVITPNRAQMLATAPIAPRVLDRVMYANYGYDYFRQREDGVVLLGGQRHRFKSDEATDVAEPTAQVQAALDAYLRDHLPFTEGANVTHRWAGIMGFSTDELPLVGQAPGFPDGSIHVLAGFTGHGLGLATVLAKLWVDVALSRATATGQQSLELFSPGRFFAPVA